MLCISLSLPHSLFTLTRTVVFAVHAILKLTLRILLSTQLVTQPSRKDPLVPNTNMGNFYLLPRAQIVITLSSHINEQYYGVPILKLSVRIGGSNQPCLTRLRRCRQLPFYGGLLGGLRRTKPCLAQRSQILYYNQRCRRRKRMSARMMEWDSGKMQLGMISCVVPCRSTRNLCDGRGATVTNDVGMARLSIAC